MSQVVGGGLGLNPYLTTGDINWEAIAVWAAIIIVIIVVVILVLKYRSPIARGVKRGAQYTASAAKKGAKYAAQSAAGMAILA